MDRRRRILLLRHAGVNGEVFWAPPGGGLEGSETFEEAAIREASEELGLTPISVKRLWERTATFTYIDQRVHQQECYFLIEAEMPNISPETQRIHTREGILEMRWWTTDEIDLASEPVFPEGLTSELRKLTD